MGRSNGLALRTTAIAPASELETASAELDPEGWSVFRNDTGKTFEGRLGEFDVRYWPYLGERSLPNRLRDEAEELGLTLVRPVNT